MQKVGIAADHGGFALKEELVAALESNGYTVEDFGAHSLAGDDDYPDLVIPLARAIANGEIEKGIAVCGSGVGACIVANKIPGVRAALIHDIFSAHQGVEDDNMNLICLGGRVVARWMAWEFIQAFLNAKFIGGERHKRRLAKVEMLEHERNANE
jgi:ribose 5-phosphate isomerase B